ncbi:MAG: cytochrome c [Gammaproteobacteria bacterium]
MRFLLIFAVATFAHSTTAADMTGDADAGKIKAAVCGACHGSDGNSINPEWPNLAGQHPAYIVSRLKAYKSGEGFEKASGVYGANVSVMKAQAAGLSEQDMHNVAAYFASQTVKPGEADPALVELGGQLYRLGNEDTNVPSCAACHGPKGAGNPKAMMPAVAGQRSTYTVNQLNAFAKGMRHGGINNMMHGVATAMSDEEIKAVASFLEGLH